MSGRGREGGGPDLTCENEFKWKTTVYTSLWGNPSVGGGQSLGFSGLASTGRGRGGGFGPNPRLRSLWTTPSQESDWAYTSSNFFLHKNILCKKAPELFAHSISLM